MKKSLMVLITFLLLVFQIYAQSDKEALEAEVEKMSAEMTEQLLAGDFTSTVKYYTEDAYSLPANQPMVKGKEALKAAAERNQQSGVKFTKFDFDTEKIYVSGNLGYEIGTYDMEMEVPGMQEPITDTGKYINIYEKQDDGRWLIKAEIWNSSVNMMGEM